MPLPVKGYKKHAEQQDGIKLKCPIFYFDLQVTNGQSFSSKGSVTSLLLSEVHAIDIFHHIKTIK